MLYPRIIPCLLMKRNGLVKTIKFDKPKYVGDPLNAVKIFNEKEVDELIILDIDATTSNSEPKYKLIESLAIECRMPLCYGGGIKNTEQAQRILGLGVEKVALSSAAISNPKIVCDLAKIVGSQSVAVVLDVKKYFMGKKYYIVTHNGIINTKMDPETTVKILEDQGVGEIIVNSYDLDGSMAGYDIKLLDKIRKSIRVPITALGGAGNLQDIGEIIRRYGVIGAAAGSMFVFKGKYRAVLINYPSTFDKNNLIKNNLKEYYKN